MIFISILILIVAIALPSFNKQFSPVLFNRISAIIFLYSGALSFNALYIQAIGSGLGIYGGLFHVTLVSQLLEVFLFVIGALILMVWPVKQISDKYTYQTEYSLIVLFSTLGASLLVSSADLVSMYLSIELQSFGVYILATLYRESESATSAGLKYFLLGGLSSCLILLGAGLIYSFTGLTNFESIYSLISVSDSNSILQGLSLGLILVIVGFLFKIAAAPLHNWAPDVYDDSPTIVTIWLTIMPKISILILLLELHTQIGVIGGLTSVSSFASLGQDAHSFISLVSSENTIYVLKNLLLISSLFSLLIGTVVGLAQTKIKRLLAYSTISHIGFILLALAINTEQSIDSLIFYIIQYSLTNLNTFLIIIALGYTVHHTSTFGTTTKVSNNTGSSDIKYINELKGQFFSNPLLSLSLSVCLFSMSGIPPLMGFFSKQFVLSAAMESGYYFMAVVAILVSVISASYYLKIVKVLHTEEIEGHITDSASTSPALAATAEEGPGAQELNFTPLSEFSNVKELSSTVEETPLTNFHSFLISSLTLSILLFVLKPSIILNSTQLLSLSLYNY